MLYRPEHDTCRCEEEAVILTQVIGAILASGALRFLFPQNQTLGARLPAGSERQSFALEIILTFLLMLTILNVSTGAKEKGITARIVVGGFRRIQVGNNLCLCHHGL